VEVNQYPVPTILSPSTRVTFLAYYGQMSSPKIHWQEWPNCPSDGGDCGDGIHFHDTRQPRRQNLVAFVEGFEWLRNPSASVKGYHIKPNAVTTARVLGAMKRRIERMIADQSVRGGMISRRIYACANA